MKKPVRVSLASQIITAITEKIASKEWPVDSKIPPEMQLSESFGVSRNTVREAITALNQVGLLDSKTGDGTYVVATNRFEATMYQELGKVKFHEVKEARHYLEKNLAHLAAQRRTAENLQAMEAALQRRNAQEATLEEIALADIDFHLEMAKAANNQVLFDLYDHITHYLYQLIFERMAQDVNFDAKDSEEQHNALYQAIEQQDCQLAEKIIGEISL